MRANLTSGSTRGRGKHSSAVRLRSTLPDATPLAKLSKVQSKESRADRNRECGCCTTVRPTYEGYSHIQT